MVFLIGFILGYIIAMAFAAWISSIIIKWGRFQFYGRKYKIEKVEDDNG